MKAPDWMFAVREWLSESLSEHVLFAGTVVVLSMLGLVTALVRWDVVEWGFAGKTIWDMLEVLGVPLTVVVIAGLFAVSSQRAAQRADLERELQNERAQEGILQAYLQQMTDLLVAHNLSRARKDSTATAAAHAQTYAALRTIDGPRKGVIVRFLHDAGLITRGRAVIDLALADLRSADLAGAQLGKADLKSANLQGADFLGANLRDADLQDAAVTVEQLARAADLVGARMTTPDGETVTVTAAVWDELRETD